MKRNESSVVFTSKIIAVITMIGVAVGLGNVWRFPYMMGKYGGSAFLFLYLLLTFLFAVPALLAEISLGKISRSGPVKAFQLTFGPIAGKVTGFILLVTIIVAGSYYAVVIANVIYATLYSVFYGFDSEHLSTYANHLGNGQLQYGISLVVIGLSCVVVHRGLKEGIEKVSKIFVPFFLVSLLYLIFHSFSIDGAQEKFLQFVIPDFSVIGATEFFAALGQAFYSLSLGGTFMVVYGSYLNQNENVAKLAPWIAVGDVGAALLVSLFIVPSILVFNLDMTAGPTLIFSTLPELFAVMPMGRFIGSLFLLALSAVAFLSLVAAYEVAHKGLMELKVLRNDSGKLLVLFMLVQGVLAWPSAMDDQVIGALDLIFGSGMQLLGSGLTVIAIGWFIKRKVSIESIFGSETPGLKSRIFINWLRWVLPAALLIVLIGYIYDSIH